MDGPSASMAGSQPGEQQPLSASASSSQANASSSNVPASPTGSTSQVEVGYQSALSTAPAPAAASSPSSSSPASSPPSSLRPQRFTYRPSVASPLRVSVHTQATSSGSDDSTPTGSPASNLTNPIEQAGATSESTGAESHAWMQSAKSHPHRAGAAATSQSGSTTPTGSMALPLHHQAYQTPSQGNNEHRRNSESSHLAVHMSAEPLLPGSSAASQELPHWSVNDTADVRRNDSPGAGLFPPNYGLSSGLVSSSAGGFASSVDADYYSLPPSRLVSRTPTPVLSNQAVASSTATSLAGYRPSSPEYTNSTATESEGDDSDFPSAPGWGGAREVASMLGFGNKAHRYRRVSRSKEDHQMETRKGLEHPDTSGMDLQRGFRGKERSKAFEAHSGSLPRSGGLLEQRNGRSSRRKKQSNTSKIPWPFRVFTSLLFKTLRTFFGPVHPLTIIAVLCLVAGFVTSVTMLIIYILNPDKEPLPWRTYCQQQMPFPHAYADALAPVNILVGVVTTDSKYERRNIIRQTYAKHTLPTDSNGNPTANVQVKFILGKVRKSHARRVALEMESFNDIVILDLAETQSARKTLAFMQWASENATVPFLRPLGSDWSNVDMVVADSTSPGGLSDWHLNQREPRKDEQRYQLGWKKVDYVVKADDDSFIVLDELERHLRVAPRQMTYWGYLIKNWFMGGEAYALSFDLVQWIANSHEVARTAKGKEDTRTPQWIALHPNRSSINWVSEHCWIYDHPKGGSPYSHGFLFPDYVEKIKLEARRGLSEQEIAYRGGDRASQSYSTVTRWHQKYSGPRGDLTVEEEVEALVEGGGRWAGTWVRNEDGSEGEAWVPYEDIVYESSDSRLTPSVTNGRGSSVLAGDVGWEPSSGLFIYGSVSVANNSSTGAQKMESRDLLSDLSELPSHLLADGDSADLPQHASSSKQGNRPAGHYEHYRPHLLPLPTHKDGNGEYAALRAQRYLHRPHGGTVVVHYLKKTEWWLETALALSGKSRMWFNGAGGLGKDYRMGGSPIVRADGFISPGRSQPRPMEGIKLGTPLSDGTILASTMLESKVHSSAESHEAASSSSSQKGSNLFRRPKQMTQDSQKEQKEQITSDASMQQHDQPLDTTAKMAAANAGVRLDG